MKIIISLIIAVQILTLTSFAEIKNNSVSKLSTVETVQLEINDNSLICEHGKLEVFAPGISHLVAGVYPDFRFQVPNFDNPCFYRLYFLDKASQNGGQLSANVEVQKNKVEEPIVTCKKKPCAFCDPDCTTVGYKEYFEESVSLEILGLRFHAKSKLK